MARPSLQPLLLFCSNAEHHTYIDVWANYLYDLDGTEVVGFDVGLCTMTPAINNTGSLYELCNIVHYFNNGADQVVLNGANNFNNQVRF